MIPRAILITGASRGLGASLAEIYAGPGVTLYLGGRNAERLDAVRRQCIDCGADASVAAIDVTDRAAMDNWVAHADAQTPLDLVIANAAVTGGTRPGNLPEDLHRAQRLLSVNLFGQMNTIHPAMERMIPRRRGQVALVSSLAGYIGFPFSPAYCASKAALKIYGESLRGLLIKHNVTVSVVCPGFMDTPMNETINSPMPFMISALDAAERIKQQLSKGRRLICLPRRLYWLTLLQAAIPRSLSYAVMARMSVSIPQTPVEDDIPPQTDANSR